MENDVRSKGLILGDLGTAFHDTYFAGVNEQRRAGARAKIDRVKIELQIDIRDALNRIAERLPEP